MRHQAQRAAIQSDDHATLVRALVERLRREPPCPACTPGPDWRRDEGMRGWIAPLADVVARSRIGLAVWRVAGHEPVSGITFVSDDEMEDCRACGDTGSAFRWGLELGAFCGSAACAEALDGTGERAYRRRPRIAGGSGWMAPLVAVDVVRYEWSFALGVDTPENAALRVAGERVELLGASDAAWERLRDKLIAWAIRPVMGSA